MSRRLLIALATAAAVLLAAVGAAIASGAPRRAARADAASGTVEASGTVGTLLANTVPSLVGSAQQLGLLDPARQLTVDLPLALPDRTALNDYVSGEYTPGSPDYRHFLTPAQFGTRFGASAATVARTLAALRALGLQASTAGPGALYVRASGTVATLEQAFGVTLANLKGPGGAEFFSNLADIHLPAALSGLVTGVVGLDSAGGPQSQLAPAVPNRTLRPEAASAVDGGGKPCPAADLGLGYTAPDLAQAYDFNGLYAKGFHGEGMSAALVEFDDYHDSNVAGMEACYGLSTPVTRRTVDGGVGGTPGPGEAEDMADITMLLEMLPKLQHLYVYEAPITDGASVGAPAAEIDLYNAFVTDDSAPVLSSSWGSCEELQNGAYDSLLDTVAEQAAAQGQQIFDAAGDSGAVDCRGSGGPVTGSISTESEAAVPWITGVGGTDLSEASTVAALNVHREDTWNDAGAGGGGESTVYPMPSWQSAYLSTTHDSVPGASDDCGAPNGGLCRMVPDISLDADPEAGGLLNGGPEPPQFAPTDVGSPGLDTYCATSNCSFLSGLIGLPLPIGISLPGGAGNWYPIGGTSLATPLAASAAVLWDQEAKSQGLGTVGFLNPELYRIAADPGRYGADFHDITSGTNDDQYDTADCPAGCNPNHLYAARSGYDMATGLGSIDAAKLGADVVASAGHVELTPSATTMYGYLKGPATTKPVSVTTGARGAAYTAKSSASWLIVTKRGRAPGTLQWHVNPKRLKRGTHRGHITVLVKGAPATTLQVTYLVTPRSKLTLSASRLSFSERPIDAKGATTAAQCFDNVYNDEAKDQLNGSSDTTAIDPSTRQTLKIGNAAGKGSLLHYAVDFTTESGQWLSQDINPGNNATAFQTVPQQPIVQTAGVVRGHGTPASVPFASIANLQTIAGYAPLNQGTYTGVIRVRDLADPAAVKTIPVTLVLGSGQGTPTIAAAPTSFSEHLAPGGSTTVDLALSDAAKGCGYAYSVGSGASWATPAAGLDSGRVPVPAATAAPTATDTGQGNGYVPVTISAAGLAAGTYHTTLTVQSQDAQNNPTSIPVTLVVS